ncbi:amidohydrolase family protein [Streptomyces pseudoechinosporeus]
MSAVGRVDAHHHLWDLSAHDHSWLEAPALGAIRRDFGPQDLAPLTRASGIDGTVLVQALPSTDETSELLAVAARTSWVAGVVGWCDLTAADLVDHLTALRRLPGGERLVGIRHPVQAEPNTDWLARPTVQAGLRALGETGLAYDLLVRPWQLPSAAQAVRTCPDTTFVLDHLGQPPLARGEFASWARSMRELAAEPRVFCKLSGLLTLAGCPDDGEAVLRALRPYVEFVWETFGPARVMFGSDWPVCLLSASYDQVTDFAEQLCAGLCAAERADVFGGTAVRAYALTALSPTEGSTARAHC